MASTIRRRDRTVREHMLRHYGDFNVFQLMRLLLAESDDGARMGERLRFRADLSAAFPAREFTQLKLLATPDRADGVATHSIEISTANFCIASVIGPLPESFTEWVRELAAARYTAMSDFLDIFNQRANILRFQMKQELTMGLHQAPPQQTGMAHCMAALMGLSQPQLASQMPMPARNWLGLAGLLANRRKQSSTIVHMLSLALGAPVRLTPFIGAWQEIDEQDRCLLGRRNHRLGRTSVAGRRVWDQQARFRLDINVADYDALCRLLPPALRQLEPSSEQSGPPGTAHFELLDGMVRLLVDRLADCEVVLHVAASGLRGVPLAQPSRRRDANSWRLGQTAWLLPANEEAARDAQPREVRYLISTTKSLEAA